jgi:hypothetical protein
VQQSPPEDNLHQLREMAQEFALKRLPVLKRLMVV